MINSDIAASWEDFDDDGDQDLYVANDFGCNNLYRNDEGVSQALLDLSTMMKRRRSWSGR